MTTSITIPDPIAGLHHVTGITGDVQKNVDFYTRTLGMRRVKVTINYDDPQTYHLYYGDALGRPGTAITFFGWQGGRPARAGAGQVSETAFAIPRGAAAWWAKRLTGQEGAALIQRFGETGVTFHDPDGMPLAVIETPEADDIHIYGDGGIPAEAAIRGFHGITLSEHTATLPAAVLTGRFGYREIGRESNRVRYEAQGAGSARIVDVLVDPALVSAHMGVGQMHHVAFRTPSDQQQALWLETLAQHGHQSSPVMDRDYFHSIYFREPGGTLFEIATDGPGFTINETPELLGTKLVLPAWLEAQRKEVEAGLPLLRMTNDALAV